MKIPCHSGAKGFGPAVSTRTGPIQTRDDSQLPTSAAGDFISSLAYTTLGTNESSKTRFLSSYRAGVLDRLGKPKPPMEGPTSDARRMLTFSAGSPGWSPFGVIMQPPTPWCNTDSWTPTISHGSFSTVLRRAYRPSYIGCRAIHSTSEVDLPIFAPLPIFTYPSALSSFGLEKTSHLLVLEALVAVLMGSPNGMFLQHIHVGEPALSWKATVVGPLQRSTKRWRHFQIHPLSPPCLYFSDMASSEPAFNMVENRGMETNTDHLYKCLGSRTSILCHTLCPNTETSVSLLSPPFPAEPVLRNSNVKWLNQIVKVPDMDVEPRPSIVRLFAVGCILHPNAA